MNVFASYFQNHIFSALFSDRIFHNTQGIAVQPSRFMDFKKKQTKERTNY